MADFPISGLVASAVCTQRLTDIGLWIEPCDTDKSPLPALLVVLGQTWNFSSGTGLLPEPVMGAGGPVSPEDGEVSC